MPRATREHADRRAWHLAAAALGNDEEAVQALEAAAERAAERAGHAAAARALERAAELTAPTARRAGRRLTGAARAASLAGADERAAALARQARTLVDDPLALAELALVSGIAERRRGRPADARPAAPGGRAPDRGGRVREPRSSCCCTRLPRAARVGNRRRSSTTCRLAAAIVPDAGDDGRAP